MAFQNVPREITLIILDYCKEDLASNPNIYRVCKLFNGLLHSLWKTQYPWPEEITPRNPRLIPSEFAVIPGYHYYQIFEAIHRANRGLNSRCMFYYLNDFMQNFRSGRRITIE